MNDINITQAEILDIVEEQEDSYSLVLENILKDKYNRKDKTRVYESEIFALEKVIRLNKRLGNQYAMVRDEVLVKSYKLLNAQTKMVTEVLKALDQSSFEKFNLLMNEIFLKNQKYNFSLGKSDYEKIMSTDSSSKVLKQAQKNIKNFRALQEINIDSLKYLSLFEKKMYRLNKYAKYNLIDPVLFINNLPIVNTFNNLMEPYGLNMVKLILMMMVILVIYFIRIFLDKRVEAYIHQIKSLKKYSKDILNSIRKPLEIVIILINIEIIIYIYDDFTGAGVFGKIFNVAYIVLITYMIYKVINIIASIKMYEINTSDKQIKNEVINVGMKMLNFFIMLIGTLVALHFIGVDLTTVLSGLGIGGLAVALAAKDSLANFFGTLSILLSDVYSQGDWIVIDGNEGTVVEIGLRVTTLRTFDNAIIAIPNSLLANNGVKNWNKRSLGRRIKMNLGIKYNAKHSDIHNAIEEIRIMLDQHPQIATKNTAYDYSQERTAKIVSKEDEIGIKKTLLVYLDEFSESSINILIYCFSKTVVWDEWLTVKEEIMYEIMKILEKNSLEFAFPSMSIYHENNQKEISN